LAHIDASSSLNDFARLFAEVRAQDDQLLEIHLASGEGSITGKESLLYTIASRVVTLPNVVVKTLLDSYVVGDGSAELALDTETGAVTHLFAPSDIGCVSDPLKDMLLMLSFYEGPSPLKKTYLDDMRATAEAPDISDHHCEEPILDWGYATEPIIAF
jgi:hypothetical protein